MIPGAPVYMFRVCDVGDFAYSMRSVLGEVRIWRWLCVLRARLFRLATALGSDCPRWFGAPTCSSVATPGPRLVLADPFHGIRESA